MNIHFYPFTPTNGASLTRTHAKGFSLIEILSVIVLVGILSSIIANMLGTGLTAFNQAKLQNNGYSQLRVAMDRITRELRTAKNIVSIGASSIQLNDINNSAISFQLAGNILDRNATPLAKQISALSFTERSGNCVIVGSPYQCIIDISITSDNASGLLQLNTSVFIRGVK
ncbi:MAG: prepilin-type N-terminal cleavage/methylation domain-containing protein [Magnetococcales bacterium]|nr:prepilin-type N-terminal cleavage/methylation domain-containing protein [Magnetococcales bacterium]